jgi:tRNA A22 N-methylase
MSLAEATFGPKLLAEKSPLIKAAIRLEIEKISGIIDQLSLSDLLGSREKRVRLKKRVEKWEALL